MIPKYFDASPRVECQYSNIQNTKQQNKYTKMKFFVILLCLCHTVTSQLSFLAIGDWGGQNDSQPTTSGQIAASHGMSIVASDIDAKGILLLGDNFYHHGVESNTSSRFNITFEQVYPVQSFQNLPFYVVAGNHDWKGNVQAQIEYHDFSDRWHFPELYYKLPFNFTSSTGIRRTIDIIMIDTVTLVGECVLDFPGCTLALQSNAAIENAETHWQWLSQQLNTSTADYLFVGGHFPIYSAGSDGTTPDLVSRLLPMLAANGGHYISGHDHMHEHVAVNGVNMFVTGPGRECCYEPIKLDTVPKDAMKFMISGENGTGTSIGPTPTEIILSGFSSLTFDDSIQVKMYNQNGICLYSAPPISPRTLL